LLPYPDEPGPSLTHRDWRIIRLRACYIEERGTKREREREREREGMKQGRKQSIKEVLYL
jgi:hypothetical protein